MLRIVKVRLLLLLLCMSHASDPDLDLWSLEKIGITDSPHGKRIMSTVSYRDDRYFVTWP